MLALAYARATAKNFDMTLTIIRRFMTFIIAALFISISSALAAEHQVWFDKQANHFTESCPLGNGRLGAMLFGGVEEERLNSERKRHVVRVTSRRRPAKRRSLVARNSSLVAGREKRRSRAID